MDSAMSLTKKFLGYASDLVPGERDALAGALLQALAENSAPALARTAPEASQISRVLSCYAERMAGHAVDSSDASRLVESAAAAFFAMKLAGDQRDVLSILPVLADAASIVGMEMASVCAAASARFHVALEDLLPLFAQPMARLEEAGYARVGIAGRGFMYKRTW